jgi:hypothetical protein
MVSVGQVFVAGGLPGVTYVPRDALKLERLFADYLDERGRILSLSCAGSKPLVFDGLRVVIASVPHRAFDAVRVEKPRRISTGPCLPRFPSRPP